MQRLAIVVLPRNRARTELGYVCCFLTDTLIKIMVSSTKQYAESLQASATFDTDAAACAQIAAPALGNCQPSSSSSSPSSTGASSSSRSSSSTG